MGIIVKTVPWSARLTVKPVDIQMVRVPVGAGWMSQDCAMGNLNDKIK